MPADSSAQITGADDLLSRLSEVESLVTQKNVIARALRKGAEPIRARAQELAPIDPEKSEHPLKEEMSTNVTEQSATEAIAKIGPSRKGFYGCVFGGHTFVSIEKGQKHICSVRAGDEVLTQTGEFRKVLATFKYPALEKPDLVTITARYRSGSVHTLTLTPDHKVLVFRDGRHAWIPAGELTLTDKAIKRTKKSWSEGTALVADRSCEICRTPYKSGYHSRNGLVQSDRFCSARCRVAYVSARHVGMKRSDASKARMSVSAIRKLAERPELHPSRIMSRRGHRTSAERSVETWLDERAISYERQRRIGRMYADFYIPATKTVVEADGAYWHRNQSRDIDRDRRIVHAEPGTKVVHLHFFDKRWSPQLERNPLPGVFYVPCNPGPKSFVEPTVFEETEILSLTPWRYERKFQPSGLNRGGASYLYDLSVEGVHSFVASGLVISNSFEEFGTAHSSAAPFLRPAWDEKIDEALDLIKETLGSEIDKAFAKQG